MREQSIQFTKEVDEILNSLINYIDTLPQKLSDDDIKDIQDKLTWVRDYFCIQSNNCYLHKDKQIPDLFRGNVVLVKNGENFGMEFSGDHPAIILRNCKIGLDQVLILPLTSKKPKAYKDNDGIYLEFGRTKGLTGFQDIKNKDNPDNGKHWANILNIRNISKSRIHMPPNPVEIDGRYLTKISGAICSQIALRKDKVLQLKTVDKAK